MGIRQVVPGGGGDRDGLSRVRSAVLPHRDSCALASLILAAFICACAKPAPVAPSGITPTPAFPHSSFRNQNLCLLSQVSDLIVTARVASVGKPELRELELWPGNKAWWTALTLEMMDTRRGEKADTLVALVAAEVRDGQLESLPAFTQDGSWFFLKKLPSGEFWLGVDSIGVRSKGRVVFVNNQFDDEGLLVAALKEAEDKPECGTRKLSRLDQAINK